MQRKDLHFVVSDLPDGTTLKLISSYLSLFGKVDSCTYDECSRCAHVFFSESDDPQKVLNARHRFLGSPVSVCRAPSTPIVATISPPLLSVPSLPLFVAPADSCASEFRGMVEAKVSVSPPGTKFHSISIVSPPTSCLFLQISFVIWHSLAILWMIQSLLRMALPTSVRQLQSGSYLIPHLPQPMSPWTAKLFSRTYPSAPRSLRGKRRTTYL